MANQQKIGKNKSLMRSGREKSKNASIRKHRIATARKNHIAHAKQSCGKYFAQLLEKKYAANPEPGTKVGRRERKK